VTALDTYVQHVDRSTITGHPVVWATHHDIWGEPLGEIGIPADMAPLIWSVFAALAPFVLLPTVGRADLIVDCGELTPRLSHVEVRIDWYSASVTSRSVAYEITDEGLWRFTDAVPDEVGVPKPAREAVALALQARSQQVGWSDSVTYGQALESAARMLVSGGRK
jgi:hypothetical protein